MCIDAYTCMLTLHSPNANNIASIYSGAFYRFHDYELVPQIPFKLLLALPHGPHTLFSVKARTLMGCLDRSTQRTWRLRQHHPQVGVHVTGRGARAHSLCCTSGDRGQLHCGEADEEQQRRRRGRPQDLLYSVGRIRPYQVLLRRDALAHVQQRQGRYTGG
jgi:hypothetical protein